MNVNEHMEEHEKKYRLTFQNGTVTSLIGTVQQLRDQLEFLIEQINLAGIYGPTGNTLLLYVENPDNYIRAIIEEIEENEEE